MVPPPFPLKRYWRVSSSSQICILLRIPSRYGKRLREHSWNRVVLSFLTLTYSTFQWCMITAEQRRLPPSYPRFSRDFPEASALHRPDVKEKSQRTLLCIHINGAKTIEPSVPHVLFLKENARALEYSVLFSCQTYCCS